MKGKPSPTQSEPKALGNYIDAFVKQMFGRVVVFVDFLVNYADQKFVAEIDLTKIKPAPTHYIGQQGDERIVDLVFQCPLKDGSGNLMTVIVFEHQGGNLKKIPKKLLKYISAIWEAETKEGKKVLSAPYFIVLRTGKEKAMRKTMFEKIEARGKAEGKIEALLTVLRAKFYRVPKETEKMIRQMTDPIALDSWTAHAATCQSMDEFAEALK